MEKEKVFRSFIPKGIKNAIKKSMGITTMKEQITAIQMGITTMKEQIMAIKVELSNYQEILYGEDIWERSKRRWRNSEPEKGLTWGKEISGDDFVKKLQHYVTFDKNVKILEIGPGYGRLLKSILAMKLDFKKYVGLEISEKNIRFLKLTYADEAIDFVLGDVESFSSSENFDVVFSSLTFKHLFPTFENALKNLSRCLGPGGIILFDLREGDGRTFESDLVTYLHCYSKKTIIEILEKVSLELVAFDQVKHMPDFVRLLVVAKKGESKA